MCPFVSTDLVRSWKFGIRSATSRDVVAFVHAIMYCDEPRRIQERNPRGGSWCDTRTNGGKTRMQRDYDRVAPRNRRLYLLIQTKALLHRLRTAREVRPWLYGGLAALVLLSLVSVTLLVRHASTTVLPPPRDLSLLPGQQEWVNGASSYLFGTNDTYEWSSQNIETQPAIQTALRTAGFTLLRTFFPDGATDAVIDQRMQTITNSGTQCLGVITDTADTAFDVHLVQHLGDHCDLYELGNEPDYNHVAVATYLKQWNTLVPAAPAHQSRGEVHRAGHLDGYRRRRLHAKLPLRRQDLRRAARRDHFLQLVSVLPRRPSRLPLEGRLVCRRDLHRAVHGEVDPGRGAPRPGIRTEWNYDPGNPPPAYGDDASSSAPSPWRRSTRWPPPACSMPV